MADLKDRILEIIGRPQLCGLATVTEDGCPWVRYVMAVAAPDMALRLATIVAARKVSQVAGNPEVHLTCGITDPTRMMPYLQIQGRAEVTTDKDERHAFWSPMLEQIFAGPDDPKFAVMIVRPYRIEYCMPGTLEPEVWTSDADG